MAAVAGQISALPKNHRLGAADLVLPLDSLSNVWTLTIVLAALFSNSSLAITSVVPHKSTYDISFQAVSPTVVVASTRIMSQACKDKTAAATGIAQGIGHWQQTRSLASGVMPTASRPLPSPRLIYVCNRAGLDLHPLESNELFELRILTGARIVYALTGATVAGAIAQTNIFDYQSRQNAFSKHAHFGPPLSCVEIKLAETSRKSEDETPLGLPVVFGPAVVGEETRLHQLMTITDSNTLVYA